jgi:hypothetical protein
MKPEAYIVQVAEELKELQIEHRNTRDLTSQIDQDIEKRCKAVRTEVDSIINEAASIGEKIVQTIRNSSREGLRELHEKECQLALEVESKQLLLQRLLVTDRQRQEKYANVETVGRTQLKTL